jgi:pentatricopeptide repeat protein
VWHHHHHHHRLLKFTTKEAHQLYNKQGITYNCFIMLRPRIFAGKENIMWARCLSSLQRPAPKAGLVKNPVGYEQFTKFDAAQASRRQHQLATSTMDDDQQLRETRRLLVLSLHQIAMSFPKYSSSLRAPPPTSLPLESSASETDADSEKPQPQPPPESLPSTPPVEAKYLNRTTEEAPTKTPPRLEDDSQVGDRKAREAQLWNAIRRQDVNLTLSLFHEAIRHRQKLSQRVLVRLFYVVVQANPILAYSALQQYRTDDDQTVLTDGEMKMYLKLCSSVSLLDQQKHNRRELHVFVRSLIQDLESLERDAKQELLPKMITALATQRNVRIGSYARDLYQWMVKDEYEMKTGWLRQLLSLSKYNRQDDLPFHDIMERLAEQNGRPHPLSVIQAIHNMFPFTDPKRVSVALRAFLEFQKRLVVDDFPQPTTLDELQIDLDCLESISAGAAHSGSTELVLLVWEVLEHCNYRPTDIIYENTVIAFATGGNHLPTAFGAINSMKEDGFEVARSLLRSFSLALRSEKLRLDHGMKLLTVSSPDLQSLETVNALMSCYAERGDVSDVLFLLKTLRSNKLNPDVNSYSFAVEVLGKNIHRWGKSSDPAMIQENLDHADSILGMMEADGILPSRDLLRNYVELLCIAGESDTANMVIDDMLSNTPESVCSKALYRIAMVNAERGDFDKARYLASLITDDIPILVKKIRSREQRFRHVKHTKKGGVQL